MAAKVRSQEHSCGDPGPPVYGIRESGASTKRQTVYRERQTTYPKRQRTYREEKTE